ncbi:MAG: adenylyltransferase/cytidyltransferase family protein, partial [Lachnospiraceae bacterium]|nr:adenylyltransferase/cytidyltransferase family protein [Lachnospiraceae bacterium]
RRAKEMCDYLIVGVMSDEAIRNFKGKEPCIPYADRAAVVASCRYVDEVVEIPYKYGNSDTAWEMYHFDVQFCGTDYIGNEGRMKEKEFLEAHGAELVMFPYTEHISSSKIREKLTDQ